jgi:hypothetical protein
MLDSASLTERLPFAGVDRDVIEEKVRAICLALPGVTEKLSHGAPAFSAGKQFVQLWAGGHHDHSWRSSTLRLRLERPSQAAA